MFLDFRSVNCPIANDFSVRWCCDRHGDSNFHLSTFFPGRIYTGQLDDEPKTSTKRKHTQYRVKEDRAGLVNVLLTWRNNIHSMDRYRSVHPITWICDDNELQLLSKTHPSNIQNTKDVFNLLERMAPEWENDYAQQIIDVIKHFDRARFNKALNAACPAV